MDWLITMMRNKILVSVLWPLFLVSASMTGYLYLEVKGLKWKNEKLQADTIKALAEVARLTPLAEDALNQIRKAEEQCDDLLQYYENMPKKGNAPDGDVDDKYLDDFNRVLRDYRDHRQKGTSDTRKDSKTAPAPKYQWGGPLGRGRDGSE